MRLYSHYSGQLGLICLAVYFIMLIKGRSTYSGKISQEKNNYWFVFFWMALYSILGFAEWDTYHYYWMYENTKTSGYNVGFERFFFWLIKTLPNSYLLWRTAIWGTASVLMISAAKKLNLNSTVLCFMVPILFLTQLSVTRGAIGLALMIFCAILFAQSLEKKKIFLMVIAGLGIYASIFMHKSIILFIILLIGAWFFPLNKKTIVISLIAFPFLYGAIFTLAESISFINESDWMTDYMNRDKTEMNLNGLLVTIFRSAIIILLVYDIAKKYLNNNVGRSKAQLFMFKYAYVLLYVSFLFLGQTTSYWVSDRALHAASFPLVLCATHAFDTSIQNGGRTLIEKIIIIGFIFTTFWRQITFVRSFW